MLFKLATSEKVPRGVPHGERIARLRCIAAEARRPLLARIESLRSRDPHLQVLLTNSMFPVLIVRSTEDVLAELARAKEVLSASPEHDAQVEI